MAVCVHADQSVSETRPIPIPCMHAYIYVYIYTYLFVYTHINTYICLYIHIYMQICTLYTCICICMFVCVCGPNRPGVAMWVAPAPYGQRGESGSCPFWEFPNTRGTLGFL